MASRIFWVLLAGAALVTGMVVQDGGHIFSWDTDSGRHSKSVETKADRAIYSAWADSDVVTIDGREIRVTDAQKDAMAAAIARVVKAEANLAAVKIGRSSDEEREAAALERDRATTEMEQIKAQMMAQKDAERSDRDRTRDQIREEVRESIRDAVRG